MAVRKYPWEQWFALPYILLKYGKDYHISQSMMYQTVRNNARRYGVRVKIKDTNTSLIVEVVERGLNSESTHSNQTTVASEPQTPLASNDEVEAKPEILDNDLYDREYEEDYNPFTASNSDNNKGITEKTR